MDRKKLTALAAKAIAGDERAFEELYVLHARSILFHVRNTIHDKENYNDVAQEVALKMYKNIGQLREPYAFSSWMHSIIRTTCLNHNRALTAGEKHVVTLEDEDVFETLRDEGQESDPEAATMARMEGNRLFALVSELPALHREILVLRFFDDLSYKEIAEAQSISITNVSTRLQRAMNALREAIEQTGDEYGTWNRGTSMRQDTEHVNIPAGEVQDTMGLVPALQAGLVMLIPDEAIKVFSSSTGAKVASLSAAKKAAAGGAAAVPSVAAIIAYVAAGLAVVFALAVGGMAVAGMQEPAENPAGTETLAPLAQNYSGTANIVFTDASGGDTDLNVVEVNLIEGVAAAVQAHWQLYSLDTDIASVDPDVADTGTALLQEGSGMTIPRSVLTGLPPGNYHVIFQLQDSEGVSAQVTRSFTMQ